MILIDYTSLFEGGNIGLRYTDNMYRGCMCLFFTLLYFVAYGLQKTNVELASISVSRWGLRSAFNGWVLSRELALWLVIEKLPMVVTCHYLFPAHSQGHVSCARLLHFLARHQEDMIENEIHQMSDDSTPATAVDSSAASSSKTSNVLKSGHTAIIGRY